jgi:hypothetical protein
MNTLDLKLHLKIEVQLIKLMKFLYLYILSTILLLCMLPHSIYCQQSLLNTTVTIGCPADNPSAPKGYLCNSPQKSCNSFLSFRSKFPYYSPVSIAYLLGNEASTIASINNISINETIPSNRTIIVPISCSCSGNIYQHNTTYTFQKADTFFRVLNETYQHVRL